MRKAKGLKDIVGKKDLKDIKDLKDLENIELNDQQKKQLQSLSKGYEKYKDMNEQQLKNEMGKYLADRTVRDKIKSGQVDQLAKTISPMLDKEQQKKMSNLLDWVKHQV